MKDERELILRAKKGDSVAFGVLYDRHLPAIYRFILLKVGGAKGEAEDLTHEVFLNAWRNVGHYEFKGFPFTSWLYRIARNAVIDHYRTAKKNINLDAVPEEVFAERSDVGERLDASFAAAEIRVHLAKLEPVYQDVLIMKFVEELTNREIAAALQKSEGAIRVIQHRALKQLKKSIEGLGK
jgi:RNA polymerase sigma-70 factor (ECF subfamily)